MTTQAQHTIPPGAILVRTTFSRHTPDGDDGYADEHGYEDEEGRLFELSADPDDPTPAEEAARMILDAGAIEPSRMPFDPDKDEPWWTTPDPDTDYATGELTYYSFHMHGDPDAIADANRILLERLKMRGRY